MGPRFIHTYINEYVYVCVYKYINPRASKDVDASHGTEAHTFTYKYMCVYIYIYTHEHARMLIRVIGWRSEDRSTRGGGNVLHYPDFI
jgi:hypothetical protein